MVLRNALNGGNCLPTVRLVKGREGRDMRQKMTDIWMFKCNKNNSYTNGSEYRRE